jgi:hypothetical protein
VIDTRSDDDGGSQVLNAALAIYLPALCRFYYALCCDAIPGLNVKVAHVLIKIVDQLSSGHKYGIAVWHWQVRQVRIFFNRMKVKPFVMIAPGIRRELVLLDHFEWEALVA